jgi:tRNA pseudouridine13 synthase
VLVAEGIEVLEAVPNRRKLRRGALLGNRFDILVRELEPWPADLAERVAAIRARGAPNYFGDQRFGHDQSNLARAELLFAGKAGRVPRHQSGLWLSAVRSQIFNEILAERVRRGDWDRPCDGDCLQLAGSNAYFLAETIDATILGRAETMDLHPTGALWGQGDPPTGAGVRLLEDTIAARFPSWCQGLANFGLRQERRALRVPVPDLVVTPDEAGLRLTFSLPAGAYATTLLRELIRVDDVQGGASRLTAL